MDATRLSARDLMRKDPRTIREAAPVLDAARMMRDFGVSSLVVERKDERDAFGIVTRKDIVRALLSIHGSGTAQVVADVMTKPALTVNPDLSIDHCLQIMRMMGVRRVPVVEGNTLVGILSNSDVFRRLVQDLG